MIVYLLAFAALIGALAFTPFINRSDLSLLSGYFIFMLCAGAPTIASLYSFINSEVSALACTSAAMSCFVSQFFAIIVAGPLLIAWIMACVEFHTGRQVS
jgi:type II secretory pathway component PulF